MRKGDTVRTGDGRIGVIDGEACGCPDCGSNVDRWDVLFSRYDGGVFRGEELTLIPDLRFER